MRGFAFVSRSDFDCTNFGNVAKRTRYPIAAEAALEAAKEHAPALHLLPVNCDQESNFGSELSNGYTPSLKEEITTRGTDPFLSLDGWDARCSGSGVREKCRLRASARRMVDRDVPIVLDLESRGERKHLYVSLQQ